MLCYYKKHLITESQSSSQCPNCLLIPVALIPGTTLSPFLFFIYLHFLHLFMYLLSFLHLISCSIYCFVLCVYLGWVKVAYIQASTLLNESNWYAGRDLSGSHSKGKLPTFYRLTTSLCNSHYTFHNITTHFSSSGSTLLSW